MATYSMTGPCVNDVINLFLSGPPTALDDLVTTLLFGCWK